MSILNKYLNPKNKVAFSHIFDPENNQDVLVAMLNAILKKQLRKPIQDVAFLKNSPKNKVDPHKHKNLEFVCRDDDGGKYIIIVQMVSQQDSAQKSNSNASFPHVKQKEKENIYKGAQEVIFLAFTDYILFANTKAYKNIYTAATKPKSRHIFKRLVTVIIELPKISKQCTIDIAELPLEEKFYYFLNQASSMKDKELEKLVAQDDIVQKAFNLVDVSSWAKEKLDSYQKYEGKN